MACNKQKVALITGGGRGIGQSICLRLALKNLKILVVDLDIDAATRTVNLIEAQGGQAEAHQVNIASHQDVKSLKTVTNLIGK